MADGKQMFGKSNGDSPGFLMFELQNRDVIILKNKKIFLLKIVFYVNSNYLNIKDNIT